MEEGWRLEMCPISRQEGYVELQRVEELEGLDDENGFYIKAERVTPLVSVGLVATSSLLLGFMID